MSAFSLAGYRVRHVPSISQPLLVLICNSCPPGLNWVASAEDAFDWQMADMANHAQAHHEQHHREPHLMDREAAA